SPAGFFGEGFLCQSGWPSCPVNGVLASSPSTWLVMIRWPVDEIGRNSVTPSTTPSTTASNTLSSATGSRGAEAAVRACNGRSPRPVTSKRSGSLRTAQLVKAFRQGSNFICRLFPRLPAFEPMATLQELTGLLAAGAHLTPDQ